MEEFIKENIQKTVERKCVNNKLAKAFVEGLVGHNISFSWSEKISQGLTDYIRMDKTIHSIA